MTHTIIIPHRNRNRHLRLCISAIRFSAEVCGTDDYRIVVVDNGSELVPDQNGKVRIVRSGIPMPIFSKPVLLNHALDLVRSGVVSILDADAVVGERWMDGVAALGDHSTTRVAYRVRYFRMEDAAYEPDAEHHWQASAWKAFNDSGQSGDLYRLAWESYRFPDRNRHEPNQQPWGNSQFSMRREDIGDLRYDETMAGKGWEDIDFNRQVYRKFGDKFRGVLFTDGPHAMFHLEHPKSLDFDTEEAKQRNLNLYKAKWPRPCAWLHEHGQPPWS